MNAQLLFTDGSVDPARRIGVGVALSVPEVWLAREVKSFAAGDIASRCVVRRFENTSSTRLELDTVLWALSELAGTAAEVTLFTDSQCVVGLSDRRPRLEAGDYVSGRTGSELGNADRYRRFFRLCDARPFRIRKVTGHSDYRYQDATERIFHFVDREARRQLKRWLRESG